SAVTLTVGVYVYVVMWVLLGDDLNTTISHEQRPQFMKLGLIILGTGMLFVLLFHIGLREPNAEGGNLDTIPSLPSLLPSVLTPFFPHSLTMNPQIPFPALCPPCTLFTLLLGFAYMFTRLAQNVTNSYMPLFLTDYLNYEKIAIAYFPLVILISGVVASFGGKKLNTLLGNKWTFCIGSIMVMGASGWFYLLTQENRLVMYVPAILSGCGTSIMFVTTLALAAEFVDADRNSGAFLMASMGFIAKVVNGTLFCLLQEFTPKAVSANCPECTAYVRHVFSLTPGVSAFFGLVAFILFIPATIQCKPISKYELEMEDAETQTDEFSFSVTSSLDVINEDDQEGQPTRRVSSFNVIQEDEEDETIETREEDESGDMDTAL
ncbi:hypothetical protein QZH41_018881, partial [Actinostola sp. cb2023]